MRIKFNGFQEVKKRGCPVCGGRTTVSNTFQQTKTLVLPTGKITKFYRNKPIEVAEEDAIFLLGMEQTVNGHVKKIFEEVE